MTSHLAKVYARSRTSHLVEVSSGKLLPGNLFISQVVIGSQGKEYGQHQANTSDHLLVVTTTAGGRGGALLWILVGVAVVGAGGGEGIGD